MDKKVIPPSGQIVKGFGDDLGFDDLDLDRIPSSGKINKGGNLIMGERIVIPPSGQIQGVGPGEDTLPPVITLGKKIPTSGQIEDTLPPVITLHQKIPPSGQIQDTGQEIGFFDKQIPASGQIQATGDGRGSQGSGQLLIPASGQIQGFGDDLGFDGFDPDNSPLSKIAKQQNKIS